MTLRCLLFSSDEGTAEPILQVLTGLDVEGELCSEAAAAVDKVTHDNFQIVIIDWDRQPEAAQLLTTARQRKAAERPLTLAIVSDDISVPKALQAGANSILRKPLAANQVRDTLTTARDLLRAKQESAQAAAAGASAAGAPAGSISTLPANREQGNERNLRGGEFLHSAPSAPGGQFVIESEVHDFRVSSSVEKDLEPVAASVQEVVAPPPPPPDSGETRGLEWYLKTRGGTLPQASAQAGAGAAAAPAPAKPELLGYDQTPAYSPASAATSADSAAEPAPEASPDSPDNQAQDHEQSHEQKQEQKKEAELFSYITEGSEPEKARRPPIRLGRGAIIAALAVAACAVVAAPQAPWHSGVRAAWAHGRQTVHGWLNPQLVTTPQAPIAHEDFGRAGDEYKLPVTENIPDATTDPSQIHVIPVVDPTVKKLNNMGENAEPALRGDAAGTTPADPTPSGVPGPANQGSPSTPETAQPAGGPAAGGASTSPNSGAVSAPAVTSPDPAIPAGSSPDGSIPVGSPAPVSAPSAGSTVAVPVVPAPRSDTPVVVAPASSVPLVSAQPSQPKTPQPHTVSAPANVPSSLKSQMASMTPDAGGNKPPEAAMQAIEPVVVTEATERALLTDQTVFDSPASATGQPGTVILQVLVGRDGTVQDAKFLQGSLAFARVAIDGVKRWKFKPYIMNGRPVSVQTPLTISFKPAH
ncbi:MAG TPA: TonB family protein [Candidatus Sulfotelmatobacter sp.]|nr:TonB family protein [Candidatus Sulfotelmatobacter sp.]